MQRNKPQTIRCPVVHGQLVKERFAGVLVDSFKLCRQPSFIEVRREEFLWRSGAHPQPDSDLTWDPGPQLDVPATGSRGQH